jgi:hypothetical protein
MGLNLHFSCKNNIVVQMISVLIKLTKEIECNEMDHLPGVRHL